MFLTFLLVLLAVQLHLHLAHSMFLTFLEMFHISTNTFSFQFLQSQIQGHCSMPETCFDQSSYVVGVSNGMVTAMDVVEEKPSRLMMTQNGKAHAIASDAEHNLEN